MSTPALTDYSTGFPASAMSGDQLNTLIQSCDNIAQLRAFVGTTGLMVYCRGSTVANDGGQGFFYWQTGTATDDAGKTAVVPTTFPPAYWSRINITTSSYARTTVSPVAGQTLFYLSYSVGYVLVYINGVLLPPSDYTATNGSSITLGLSCNVGDVVEFVALNTFAISTLTGMKADFTNATAANPVTSGGTGATTAAGARANLGAAASGANSDITTITGLTSPLAVSQGGTGASSLSGVRSAIGAAASGANTDITSLSGLAYQRFLCATTGYVGLTAPATGSNITFVLPGSDGTVGQFIKTDGSGNLSFASVTPASIGAIATTARGAVNGVASLDSSGLVPSSQLPASGSYKGTWNATTNVPTITSGVGTNGDFYIVATAGSTTIDGISSWAIGDQVRFNGTVWQKIAATSAVSSVAGKTGAVVLATGDIAGVTTARIIGRTTAGTGVAEEMTGTQVTAMLDAFATASKGLVPSPVTATGKVLMDDGTWKDPGVKYASSYGISPSNTPSQNVTGFSSMAAAGVGRYILPPGTIQVNATISIGTGQVWEGAGSNVTTIQWTTAPSSGGIEATSKNNIGLRGMTLDNNSTASLLGVVNWNTIVDFYIDDLKIINMNKYGIALNNCNTGLVNNFEIIKPSKSSSQNQAIVVSSTASQSQNIVFNNGTCRNSAVDWTGADIWFDRVAVYGFSFGQGFTSEQNAYTTRGGLLYCTATDGTGVDVNSTRCGGAELWGDSVTVVGFQSFANDGMGIDFGSKNGVLSASTFINNGRGTTGFSGISMRYGSATYNASGAMVSGCRSVDTGAGTQAYGYTEQSASLANITLRANNFIGNVTGPTNILSSSTVTDSVGVSLATTTPAAVGTATVGVGTTAARSDHVHSHGVQTDETFHAAVTTSTAGFMTAADKVKLNSLSTATATTSTNGLMSSTDKTKLDAISSGAVLNASVSFGGATISNGGIGAQSTTIIGLAFGDFVMTAFSFPLQNCTAMSFVTASNSVQCVFTNNTGASVTLASGTIYFRVLKA